MLLQTLKDYRLIHGVIILKQVFLMKERPMLFLQAIQKATTIHMYT